MTNRLSQRVAKLEQQRPDDPLDQLTDEELIEYEKYLDARLRELDIGNQASSTGAEDYVGILALSRKYENTYIEHGRYSGNPFVGVSEDELLAYEAGLDRQLAELQENNT